MRSLTSLVPTLSFLVNATLVASVAVLPGLFIGYVVSRAGARRAAPLFSLGKLESIEMERAILLYERVSERLREIQQACVVAGSSLFARRERRSRLEKQFADERRDLQAYAAHLRSTIVQLRRQPIERLKSWMHFKSSQVAFGACILLYGSLVCLVFASLEFSSDHPVWLRGAKLSLDGLVAWKPFDDGLFYANWLAALFTPIALPLFYCVRRAKLRGDHRLTITRLEAFSGTDPDKLIPFLRKQDDSSGQSAASDGAQSAGSESPQSAGSGEAQSAGSSGFPETPAEATDATTWYGVLGLPPSASLEDIKTAYKALIKQNHPDRVQDMAPSFRALAETETKRLNAAYETALLTAGQN